MDKEERFGVHLEKSVFYGASWDIIWPVAVEDAINMDRRFMPDEQ
jgi:hypothetical protein